MEPEPGADESLQEPILEEIAGFLSGKIAE
jgi:hypothetical protein